MEQVLKDLAQVNPWACAFAIASIAACVAFGIKYFCKFLGIFIRGE